MRTSLRPIVFLLFFSLISMSPQALLGQTAGNAGTIVGTVTDPAGAVVPNAAVSISNPVSEYSRKLATDKAGQFQFTNLPFNPYHVTVSSTGFATVAQDVDVRSIVPSPLPISLKISAGTSTVTVEVVRPDRE